MGDEYDRAEDEYWALGYAQNAPRGGAQVRLETTSHGVTGGYFDWSDVNTLMPEMSITRGGIQFPQRENDDMRSNEDILAEAEAMRLEAERLERMVTEREKYGADPFKNGTVLKVDMRYRTGNRSYAYAVIKIAGKFYLSGRIGSNMSVDTKTGGMTWENFVAWLSQGDATVWQAGGLKQVL